MKGRKLVPHKIHVGVKKTIDLKIFHEILRGSRAIIDESNQDGLEVDWVRRRVGYP